jgi:Ca2+-binding EF-hand superfamily protein
MVDELKKQLKFLFDTYYTNHDGFLSKGEFVNFSHEVLAIIKRGGSNVVFHESDLNHDDRVSFDEFISLMSLPV